MGKMSIKNATFISDTQRLWPGEGRVTGLGERREYKKQRELEKEGRSTNGWPNRRENYQLEKKV